MTLPPLLRLAAGRKVRLCWAPRPRPRESVLHAEIAKILTDHALPDWEWRFLSSKAKDAREGAILKIMGVVPFWPDFILISPQGSVRYLEVKRKGGKLSAGQEEFRERNVRRGIPYAVASTIDEALVALSELGCLRIKIPRRRE